MHICNLTIAGVHVCWSVLCLMVCRSIWYTMVLTKNEKKHRIMWFLSPIHGGKLNWTVQFGCVQFSSPLCTEPATAVACSWQWTTCDSHRQSSQLVAGFRPTTDIALIERFTRVCPDYEEPATNTNFVAESLQVVAGSIHSGKLNWTEQFSSVQFPAVHWAKQNPHFVWLQLYIQKNRETTGSVERRKGSGIRWAQEKTLN